MAGANGIWWKVWYQISLMCLGSRQRAPTPCVPQLKKNSPATLSGWLSASRCMAKAPTSWPTKPARAMPSPSISAAMSSARISGPA